MNTTEKYSFPPSEAETRKFLSHDILVTETEIKTKEASAILQKDCGIYTTIHTGPLEEINDIKKICACVVEQLRPFLAPYFGKKLIICGIGNAIQVFDSLGPETASRIEVHICEAIGFASSFSKIAVVCPGVLAKTNLSTTDIISGIASSMDAACVLTIDSSSCTELDRLGSSIQISNAGMQVYRDNSKLHSASIGTPVISIVVPTVISAQHLINDVATNNGPLLTVTHISEIISYASFIIACAILQIAYPDFCYNDCKILVETTIRGFPLP